MLSTKPLFYYFRILPIGLLWLSSTLALRAELVLSAEIDPPKATVAELAKTSYAEEKKLEDLPTAFIEASPNAEDGLVVGTLGIDGGEVDPILNFVNEIAAGMHGDVDSLLIAYKGKLLFESYSYCHTNVDALRLFETVARMYRVSRNWKSRSKRRKGQKRSKFLPAATTAAAGVCCSPASHSR